MEDYLVQMMKQVMQMEDYLCEKEEKHLSNHLDSLEKGNYQDV